MNVELCDCGNPLRKGICQNGGPNHGKAYSACVLGKQGCGYFEWDAYSTEDTPRRSLPKKRKFNENSTKTDNLENLKVESTTRLLSLLTELIIKKEDESKKLDLIISYLEEKQYKDNGLT